MLNRGSDKFTHMIIKWLVQEFLQFHNDPLRKQCARQIVVSHDCIEQLNPSDDSRHDGNYDDENYWYDLYLKQA